MAHGRSKRAVNAERLKERIYISFAALAVLVALSAHEVAPEAATGTLVITVLGTVTAVFVADMLSHLVVQGGLPTAAELRHALAASFGAATAGIAPVLLLTGAIAGWWSTECALLAGQLCVVLGLVIVAYLAVRRVPMRWWQRIIALGVEALVGSLVVIIQVAAHGG
ncbi:hypothetical protein JF550_09510 [Microbacterium esteraromaticum]|uniref:Uncharacterized protein n=1 Tax=Microbacterium esteraromaticum TaxID=57043 RepID=A0A939IRV4_9MICO|nr:hypothetical protein [Microbacterium esteraromaticum]MBN8206195.1 hypothetical protein [Microbacterium esteraromaticum]MBN8416350.1 hypothetical protein [Microbacterium esteraromaticum]